MDIIQGLRGDDEGLDIINTSAALACVEANLVVDHNDPPLKNSLAYCGHTGAAVSGCGGDDAGGTAPHPPLLKPAGECAEQSSWFSLKGSF